MEGEKEGRDRRRGEGENRGGKEAGRQVKEGEWEGKGKGGRGNEGEGKGTGVAPSFRPRSAIVTECYCLLCVAGGRWIVKLGTITLSVKQGDITRESTDAIVNGSNAGLQLDIGNVIYLLPTGCREAANCRYCFYSGQKSGFSPRRGDSLHRFKSNLAGPTGTWVRLAAQNFTSIGAEGWECGPKISKYSTFW